MARFKFLLAFLALLICAAGAGGAWYFWKKFLEPQIVVRRQIDGTASNLREKPDLGERHYNEAVRLLKVATQAAATDPRTGRIDMDMISTGRTTNTREADQELYTALKELIAQRRGARMAIRQLVEQVSEIVPEASHDAVVSAVKQLQADGRYRLS